MTINESKKNIWNQPLTAPEIFLPLNAVALAVGSAYLVANLHGEKSHLSSILLWICGALVLSFVFLVLRLAQRARRDDSNKENKVD